MKRTTYTLMAINFVLWGYFVWSGLSGPTNSREQMVYYVVFPVSVLVVTVLIPILLRRTQWSGVGTAILLGALLLLLPFVFFYTGGM